jgi:hypothetical protein
MFENKISRQCPDCDSDLSRREFLTATAGVAAAATAASLLPTSRIFAAPTKTSPAESAVKELYATLSDDQKKQMALPLDDARRTKISANWSITSANIGSFSKSQQELIHKVIKGVTSEDGYGRFIKQMQEDWGAVEKYSIAIFGDPASDQFEFELTGRHLTLRADGDTLPGAAFGGPIVYGHGKKGNSEQNLFSYQTRRANEVFQALDGEQRKKALLENAPNESAVQLRDDVSAIPGIAGSELSGDQKELVGKALQDVMAPYRKEDVDEVMEILKAGGGIDKLQIAFYRSGDLDADSVWDVWRLEAPTLVCHFRGAPHVHAYINVARRA